NLVAKDYAIHQENKSLLLKLQELQYKLEGIYSDSIGIDIIPIQSLRNIERENNLLKEQTIENKNKIKR
ncbi:5462_t:CDS:1, partial [Dentiscutata heterogama]